MSEIWIVNHYAITPDLPGGTRHYDLAVELARRGFRVKVFASDVNLALRKHTKLNTGQLYTVEPRDGVEFVWVRAAEYESNNWRRAWNMLSFARNFIRVARRLGGSARPSAVIGSSPHPFAAWAAERVARKLGAPFILELRDLWPQALIDMGGLSEWHPGVIAMRLLERYLYVRAKKLIVLARGSLVYLEGRGVSQARTLFLPNGVHLGRFEPTRPRDETRTKYGFNTFTIVYAGAHGPANNLESIIQAGAQLTGTPVEFVLVGDGPAKPWLESLAQRQGITNVRFLAPVPKAEIPDLLNAADAGIITLKNADAFKYGISPNKLFDYMASKRPVICSVAGDMANLVIEAQAGLACPPEDPAALAQSVRQLLAMPSEQRDSLGHNGREYLERHYRREVLADHLAEVLNGITQQTQSAATNR